ncbi:YwdI family protein [Paraliobacillus sp. X-1268]|uniref:YwdI family protein n=1 Tax=Paraliobacillus sp. X-1268 TaxID=2213193 RepID=UPI000E3BB57D|nr:YwdI family protein [Paraliobacillus sp. X-1268]
MITNKKVLQKMQQEVQTALTKHDQLSEVKEHARAIRLLCDLVLDTEETETVANSTHVQTHDAQEELELRKMMGESPASSKPTVTNGSPQSKPLVEEDANGDSLFDF